MLFGQNLLYKISSYQRDILRRKKSTMMITKTQVQIINKDLKIFIDDIQSMRNKTKKLINKN